MNTTLAAGTWVAYNGSRDGDVRQLLAIGSDEKAVMAAALATGIATLNTRVGQLASDHVVQLLDPYADASGVHFHLPVQA